MFCPALLSDSARDLKDKMRFLRRRHTDSSLRDTADKLDCEKSSLVQDSTESDVRKWSDCFENLLHDKSEYQNFFFNKCFSNNSKIMLRKGTETSV